MFGFAKKNNGHIQATGRDAKGRKQYIYHQRWDTVRNEAKFYRLIKFGQSLPDIRSHVNADLNKPALIKEKVIAIIVRLLEETLIRIGNIEYASNGSYGLTTLKDEHLVIQGSRFFLVFNGKSGKLWEVDILNKRLAKLVKQCQELPGQELFRYLDEDKQLRTVISSDVNNYLFDIAGENFTAKDFRTWGGTVLAAKELFLLGPSEDEKDKKRNIVKAVKSVCRALNNTPSICRNYYIHPHIIKAYNDLSLFEYLKKNEEEKLPVDGLSRDEKSVLRLLRSKAEII